eukprot:TRINITY_DN10693_c1_g1_i3.p1 TRINITY_DN10693_c1_g1~~TRINITY_DN10693_c1_g1_i3.p1  ORF type:complete len:180 (-),score=6.91 TRINITY_DN10693_c1_g1_i3:336-875(-)
MGCGTSVSAESTPTPSPTSTSSTPASVQSPAPASEAPNPPSPNSVAEASPGPAQSPPPVTAPAEPAAYQQPVVPSKAPTQIAEIPDRQPLAASKSEGVLNQRESQSRSPRVVLPPIPDRPATAPNRQVTSSSRLEMRKPSLPPILKRSGSLDDIRGGAKGTLKRRNCASLCFCLCLFIC